MARIVVDLKPLHTLEARSNTMLTVVSEYFNLTPIQIRNEIQIARQKIEECLAAKGIQYEQLRSALVPSSTSSDVALVFDRLKIRDGWYGLHVFTHLIPLFNPRANHSVLVGDYVGTEEDQDFLRSALLESLVSQGDIDYLHSNQYFIVYVSNVTRQMILGFDSGLAGTDGYVGYADTTYTSNFKIALSTILVRLFIKHGRIIIQGDENDDSMPEDGDNTHYPFEDNGYVCKLVPGTLYDLLLAYKIERPVIPGLESDTNFLLNAVTLQPLPLESFEVQVDDAKLKYLKSAHGHPIEAAGLSQVSTADLAAIVKTKIRENYVYSISYSAEHDVVKFNIIIEIMNPDSPRRVRLLAALEYIAKSRILRLITLY